MNFVTLEVEADARVKAIAASRSMARVRDGPPRPPAPCVNVNTAIR